jgi:hypothetical protein
MASQSVKRRRARPNRSRTNPSVLQNIIERQRDICLELPDHSTLRASAVTFFNVAQVRDPLSQAGRLAEQFEKQNRSLFNTIGVGLQSRFDGNDLWLQVASGSLIGALPLLSPTSASSDYGLVVQPRFPWDGLGSMLGEMGWRVSPRLLRLPLLKRSERRVPPWVISLIVLVRLKALLDDLTRRFEMITEDRKTPRGRIHWDDYVRRKFSTGQALVIPCTFPDLRDDALLKGAIRYALERHLSSLATQREHGSYIHKLIELCERLLLRVKSSPVHIPYPSTIRNWLQRPMRSEHLDEGIQAIEWTIHERGLAGVSDLEGIPWTMSMDDFFEAWLETIFSSVARKTGASVRVGRKRETVRPIIWDPPYLGSQKSLVPDIWLEWESSTLIVDAKYKRHWQDLEHYSWSEIEEQVREQHRQDLLQVLAYGSLARTERVIVCLGYPCSRTNWQHLHDTNHLIHRAQIPIGKRSIHLWLTAIPMSSDIDAIVAPLEREVRTLL